MGNGRSPTWAEKTVQYTKTTYIDIATGQEIDKSFKEDYYYKFLNTYSNKIIEDGKELISTTRVVKLGSRKPKQLQLF